MLDWLYGALEGEAGPVPEGWQEPAGAFVEARVDGRLCGFLGTLSTSAPFHQAARSMAERALTDDPRFDPAGEGAALELRVWRVGPSRRIRSPSELEAGREGVFVRDGFHRAVHLPGRVEGETEDAESFLASACIAAGLGPEAWERDTVRVEAFAVERVG